MGLKLEALDCGNYAIRRESNTGRNYWSGDRWVKKPFPFPLDVALDFIAERNGNINDELNFAINNLVDELKDTNIEIFRTAISEKQIDADELVEIVAQALKGAFNG